MAFQLLGRTLGEETTIRSVPALLFVVVVVCFEVDMNSLTPIPLFRPGSVHSDSSTWDDCGQVCPDKLCVGSFPWKVSTPSLDSIVHPLRLCWVICICVLISNRLPAFFAEWPVSFSCQCGNVEWNGHNKSQHRKLTLEKKFLLPELDLATFRSRVRRSTNKLSWLPFTTTFVIATCSFQNHPPRCNYVFTLQSSAWL